MSEGARTGKITLQYDVTGNALDVLGQMVRLQKELQSGVEIRSSAPTANSSHVSGSEGGSMLRSRMAEETSHLSSAIGRLTTAIDSLGRVISSYSGAVTRPSSSSQNARFYQQSLGGLPANSQPSGWNTSSLAATSIPLGGTFAPAAQSAMNMGILRGNTPAAMDMSLLSNPIRPRSPMDMTALAQAGNLPRDEPRWDLSRTNMRGDLIGNTSNDPVVSAIQQFHRSFIAFASGKLDAIMGRGRRDDESGGGSIRGNVSLLSSLYLARQAYHMVQQGADMTTSAINTTRRSDLTQSQKDASAISNIPLVGPIIRSGIELADAIDGTTERVRRANDRLTLGTAINSADQAYQSAATTEHLGLSSARNLRNQLAGVSPTLLSTAPRQSFAEEFEYRSQERLQMPRTQYSLAQARSAAARRDVRDIDKELRILRAQTRNEQSVFTGNAMAATAGINGPQNQQAQNRPLGIFGGVNTALAISSTLASATANPIISAASGGRADRAEQGTGALLGAQRLEQMYTRLEQLERRRREAAVAAAQAEREEHQRLTEILQQEMATLREREQLMSRGARRAATGNQVSQQFDMLAVEAARSAGASGFMDLPQFIRERALQAAPNVVGNIAERAGEQSEYFQWQRSIGEFGTGPQRTLTDVRTAMVEMNNRLANMAVSSEQVLSNQKLDAINNNLVNILRAIERRGNVQANTVPVQQVVNNAQNSVP